MTAATSYNGRRGETEHPTQHADPWRTRRLAFRADGGALSGQDPERELEANPGRRPCGVTPSAAAAANAARTLVVSSSAAVAGKLRKAKVRSAPTWCQR
jgi:hypothetical protein